MSTTMCNDPGCTNLLSEKPLGQRSFFCAECEHRSRDQHLRQADRQETWHRQYRDMGES
jgi:hypothetical protein